MTNRISGCHGLYLDRLNLRNRWHGTAVNGEDPSLVFFCFLGEFLDCENSVYISILDGQMLSTSINGSL